jgi:hypothetical protein
MKQLPLFRDVDADIDRQVRAILDNRRRNNCSGVNGEDADLIRRAIINSKVGVA